MKPHEETWEHVSGGWPNDVTRKGTAEKIADVWATGQEDGNGTADLIAQAPAMARLLLSAEWSASGNYGSCSECPWCGSGNQPKHTADCPWVAALVAAGVIVSEPVENNYVLVTKTIVGG